MAKVVIHEEIKGKIIKVVDEVNPHNIPETGYCRFPLCKRISEHDGYCFHHKMYSDKAPKKKVQAEIPKQSARRKRERPILKKILATKIAACDGECQLKLPGCTFYAEEPDHVQKSSPNNYIDPKNINPSCRNCNGVKEKLVKLAKKKGLSKSRFAK